MSTPRDHCLVRAKAENDRPFDVMVQSSQSPAQEGIPAHSECLARGSNVFRSMLELGSPAPANGTNSTSGDQLPIIELNERHEILVLLVNLLETPPQSPPSTVNDLVPSSVPLDSDPPRNVLPWPLITTLLDVADKYDFSDNILVLLHAHLRSHASSYPLQVYALASRLELSSIASHTSSFLLYPPLQQYSVAEIKILPSAISYHLLLVLQTHRSQRLKDILTNEPLFPHDYGACPKHGTSTARAIWETRKTTVLDSIDASSSIADIMSCDEKTKQELRDCAECSLGWERAVEMMRVSWITLPNSAK
jgi:hypothetical protein